MGQDLLVESHLGSSPRHAARQLGAALARRFAPHRSTVVWELAVRGGQPPESLSLGLTDRLEAEVLRGHVRVDWTSIEIGESTWRLPRSAMGANVVLALGGEGSLAARMSALHELATPRAALSDLRRAVATAALVFQHGPHSFAVPSLEDGSRLELVDGYIAGLVAGTRATPRGLRVVGTPKLPLAAAQGTSGLPFIEPLHRS